MKMKREFTPKQLKELRELNPRVTDGLFDEIVKDLNREYSYYIFNEGYSDTYAFYEVKRAMEDIKVVNASDLYFESYNYPLIKETEAKFRDFRRYYLFNVFETEDYNYCLNELATLFGKAFINVYRLYVDVATKKIAFAYWL